MGRRATRVRVGVCFAGMFRGMFWGYVSGMFRGIMSYFTCNFGGMLQGMFRGYVSGYVTGYVSRVCTPCALLKPEPPNKIQTHIHEDAWAKNSTLHGPTISRVHVQTE